MTPLLLLVACCATLPAAPLHTFDFETPDADEGWNRKTNTTVSLHAEAPFSGQSALRLAIDPEEFSYGWVHRALPETDLSSLAGIYGAFRAPRGAAGGLMMHLCIATEGAELSYFRADLGDLLHSAGEWLEFYVPLSSLRYERGPVKTLRAAALKPGDLIQFLANLGTREPNWVDLDQVQFLNAEDAAAVARRCAEAQRERQLLPESETGGPPHPRLLLTADRLAAIRAKESCGDSRQEAYGRLVALAEEYLRSYDAADPLATLYDFAESSELEGTAWRAAMEGHLHNAGFPMEILAAAYRITGDARFGEHAATALVNAAGRLTAEEPFLAGGFTYTRTLYVRALAFGYDWLWDRLSPEQRRRVKITLVGFVTDIHERSLAEGWGRRPLHRVWNWDPGLMGACGVGMLAMEGETRLAEQAILFDCRRHLRDYLTLGVDADGCGNEGPSYLGYGIGSGVEFIEVLRRQGRGDLFTETNYHLIAPWLIAETLPDRVRWNNLSDCGHGQRPWPVYSYACGRLAELARSDPSVPGERWSSPQILQPFAFLRQFDEHPGERRLSYTALAGLMGWEWQVGPGRFSIADYQPRDLLAYLLWYEPCPVVSDPGELLPSGLHFRGRGLVVSRTGFEPDDAHLAIEAGPYAQGHDQSDKGTFTFRVFGSDLASDSGYGNDGDPEKSGSSYAHNVVLIDGQGQPMRYHNQSGGKITGFWSGPALDWTRVDAQEAWSVRYDADWVPLPTSPVRRANRTFFFRRPEAGIPPYLVVYDDIDKDGSEHEYTWQWHIPAGMRFDVEGQVLSASPRPRGFDVLGSTLQTKAASADFTFDLPQAGEYRLYGLVRAGGLESGKSDSFFVSVDDGDRLTWDLKTGAAFAWDAVSNRDEGGPREFSLEAGRHTIHLSLRETQAELARWLVLPATAEPPVDPEAMPAGAVALGAADAQMAPAPFTIFPAEEVLLPGASVDVLWAHPEGGRVETGWFATSREGAHPRLGYTVKAVNPHFLAVMVPRREGTPRPRVELLQGEGLRGAKIAWPQATDIMLLGEPGGEAEGARLSGAAGFVSIRDGRVTQWAALDATELSYAGVELHRSPERTAAMGSGAQ